MRQRQFQRSTTMSGTLVRSVAIAISALFGLACAADRGPAPPGIISDSLFVEAMTSLLLADDGANPGIAAAAKQNALTQHNVSVEDLERKAAYLAGDPEGASSVWLRIRAQVGARSGERDSTNTPSETKSPPG